MNHEVFETLAQVYAVGALDGDELAQFERHLAQGCPRCEAALRESTETLAKATLAGPPRIPPPDVRESLLRRARVESSAPARAPAPRRGWVRWAVGTAAAVVVGSALTGAYVAGYYEARLGTMAREMAALRRSLQREEASLRAQVAAYQSVVDLLRDPATRVLALRGAGPSPDATGRVIWHATAGGHVFVEKLPPAPPGKTYELWTIAGGTPRAAGLFEVDASGRGSHRAPPAAGPPVDVFAVTLEPAGGVDTPTGPIVLASK
ncbi:MAG: anti-sigma factor [Candidatus Rokubacteria bacterium]|nr:anti-sigma factor [Candidatus Rokubacteria bacterium]